MNIGTNYSLGNTFATLLLLITKLLTIVLAVVVVLGVIVWIRDSFLKNKNTKFMQDLNKDPILKAVVVITGLVVGLVLVFMLLNSLFTPNYGVNFNTRGNYYNPTLSMAGIIMILIRLLMFILVISLVLAAIMYFKNQYEKGNLNLFTTNDTNTNNNIIIETKDKK